MRIQKRLNDQYPEIKIPLIHSDPFTLLVAVLLSAQCTDKKVNQITPALFAKAPTPQKLACLSEDEIHIFIKELGLAKRKSRHLHLLSNILIEKHNSEIPRSFKELEALPGVGHKTASVVMSQAFGLPAFPVDTHIHRLAQRWGLTNGKSVLQTEHDMKKLFPIKYWNRLHLQMIYYGREFCTAKGCDGRVCYLCRELYPHRTQPIKTIKA